MARWDVASGDVESLCCEQGVFGFAFSPNGQLLLLLIEHGDSKIAELRTVQDFKRLGVFEGQFECRLPSVACFSGDSHQVVTIPADGAPKIWEAMSGRCLHTLATRAGIAGFAGRNVITRSENGMLEMWSSTSGQRLFAVADRPYCRTLVVSPVGDLACSWRSRGEDENGEEIYAACVTESGNVVHQLTDLATDLAFQSPSIAFSPRGDCIAYKSRNEDTWAVLFRTLEDQFERLPALDLRNFVGFLPCHGR